MSRASRKRRKDKRLDKRRAEKAAMKAMFESFRDSGKNSKRSKLRKKRGSQVTKVSHPSGRCWNIGCRRCSEVAQLLHEEKLRRRAGLVKDQPQKMLLSA